MSNFKTAIFVMTGILLLSFSTGYALTVKTRKPVKIKRSTVIRHTSRIKKISGTLKKIEGNILYLKNKTRYDLSGVKVLNYADKSKNEGVVISEKRRIAEMTFVNGKLKEVIIR
ncbi:MAG: hypothetical protein J7J07_03660 [Syntrophobacterales bacterium]|nr:hypothetical protein [Syntrophobacterales bacterium]